MAKSKSIKKSSYSFSFMIEVLLSRVHGKYKRSFAFLIAAAFTLLAFATAKFFFGENDLAVLLVITVLLIPTINRFELVEEKLDRKYGDNHFLRRHLSLIEVYVAVTLGILAGYLVIGIAFEPDFVYQSSFFKPITEESIASFDQPRAEHFVGVLTRNIETVVVFVLLSLFYGAGGIFLLAWNASVFAGFLCASQEFILPLLIYTIPEICGFMFASISGGVFSKAVIKEKFGSGAFRNVLRDATWWLVIAILFITIAALLESFVAPLLISI